MFLDKIGVHAQKLLTFLGSTLIIIRGGGGGKSHFMPLALLTLKNHSCNKGYQKIPWIVAKIADDICGAKKNPNSENDGKQQRRSI